MATLSRLRGFIKTIIEILRISYTCTIEKGMLPAVLLCGNGNSFYIISKKSGLKNVNPDKAKCHHNDTGKKNSK